MSILVGTGWRVDHSHELAVSSFGEQKMEVLMATVEKVLTKLLSGEHYQKEKDGTGTPTLSADLNSPMAKLLEHALQEKRGAEEHVWDDFRELGIIRGAALLQSYHAEVATVAARQSARPANGGR